VEAATIQKDSFTLLTTMLEQLPGSVPERAGHPDIGPKREQKQQPASQAGFVTYSLIPFTCNTFIAMISLQNRTKACNQE